MGFLLESLELSNRYRASFSSFVGTKNLAFDTRFSRLIPFTRRLEISISTVDKDICFSVRKPHCTVRTNISFHMVETILYFLLKPPGYKG